MTPAQVLKINRTLSTLTGADRLEAEKLIHEWTKRRQQRRFFSMYPSTGPHRRDLYPKHMEFMESGAEYRERCFMAANRCNFGLNFLEKTDHTKAPALSVLRDSNAGVMAWDGERERSTSVGRVYLRTVDLTYRLVLDNGEFLDCNQDHQVLTAEGAFCALGELVRNCDGSFHRHRVEDYQANCAKGGYLYDEPQTQVLDTTFGESRLRSDVLSSNLAWSRKDALERAMQYIRVCEEHDLDPTQGGLSQLSALYEQFVTLASPQPVLPLTSIRPAHSQRIFGPSRLPLSGREVCLRQLSDLLEIDGLDHDEPCSGIMLTDVYREYLRSSGWKSSELYSEAEQVEHGKGFVSWFFPLSAIKLKGGRSIVAILPMGYQPLTDIEVPDYHNYKCGGIYNHNCGKTLGGAFETTCHLTGRYPEWWEGRRFDKPVKFWAAGDTAKTVRDIIQVELLGSPNEFGTGMIPGEDLVKTTPKAGVPDAVDTVYIKHYDECGDHDGTSQLGLKSYDQGRIAFQGTEQDGIWLDEECPLDVYTECLIRTMTTNGLIYITFTPLKGITDVVMSFMPKGTDSLST